MLHAKFQNIRPFHDLYNYDGPESLMLHTCTKFLEIGSPVPEKKIFMVFTIYGHGGHLGHVTWTIYIIFRSPFLWMLHIQFGFDWPSSFRG